MLSNYAPARLGPLAIAACEAAEQSPAWAAPTIEFAAELAARLDAAGLAAPGRRRGYTRTHQVVLDVHAFGGGPGVVRQPAEPPDGGRLGTQELVRRGAKLDAVPELAALIARSVTDAHHAPDPGAARRLRASLTTDLWGRAGTVRQPAP